MEIALVNEQHDTLMRENERIFMAFLRRAATHPSLAVICFGQYCNYSPREYSPISEVRLVLGDAEATPECGSLSCVPFLPLISVCEKGKG
jgi:hypothetical protein